MRLIVVLLLLIGAGVLAFGTFWAGSPAAGPVVPRVGTAAPTPAPTADAPPRTQAQKGEVSLDITEAELTRRLSQQLVGRSLGQTPLGTASIESLQASLRGGRAEVTGTARLGGSSVPYSSEMAAAPDPSGKVRVRVTDARVGGVAVPAAARDDLEEIVQAEVDRLLAVQPMRVRSIEIGDGRMRVVGAPS